MIKQNKEVTTNTHKSSEKTLNDLSIMMRNGATLKRKKYWLQFGTEIVKQWNTVK